MPSPLAPQIETLHQTLISVFGQTVTYTRYGSASTTLTAVVGTRMGDETLQPDKFTTIEFRQTDLGASPTVKDTFNVDGTAYTVVGQPDVDEFGWCRVVGAR